MSKATHCESIGNNSFGNNALAEIIWGTGLKSIGVSAFSPNKDIRRLDLPEGLTTISMGAFDSWDALESLYIPSTLTTFTGAFRYCPNLTEIRVHKDSIYENRKNSLVRKPDNTLVLGTYLSDIDSSITALGERAFSGCSKMTSVTIPSTIKRLPTCVFENCTGLSEVNLPVGLQRMEAQCFYGCTNLSTIEIPNTVQFLGSGALGSTSLVHVTLPASVNSCQVNPFLLCKKLETVTIRNEGDFMPMHTDGQYPMFAGCDNLKTIRVAWEKGAVVGAPWGAPDGVEILYKGEWDDN
jgi:hypothetical protein